MTRPLAPITANDLFAATASRPAIIQHQQVQLVRCFCRECLELDKKYPGEGYQLTWSGAGRFY
jgi:hypothetical protein